jgi:hypothetical protein
MKKGKQKQTEKIYWIQTSKGWRLARESDGAILYLPRGRQYESPPAVIPPITEATWNHIFQLWIPGCLKRGQTCFSLGQMSSRLDLAEYRINKVLTSAIPEYSPKRGNPSKPSDKARDKDAPAKARIKKMLRKPGIFAPQIARELYPASCRRVPQEAIARMQRDFWAMRAISPEMWLRYLIKASGLDIFPRDPWDFLDPTYKLDRQIVSKILSQRASVTLPRRDPGLVRAELERMALSKTWEIIEAIYGGLDGSYPIESAFEYLLRNADLSSQYLLSLKDKSLETVVWDPAFALHWEESRASGVPIYRPYYADPIRLLTPEEYLEEKKNGSVNGLISLKPPESLEDMCNTIRALVSTENNAISFLLKPGGPGTPAVKYESRFGEGVTSKDPNLGPYIFDDSERSALTSYLGVCEDWIPQISAWDVSPIEKLKPQLLQDYRDIQIVRGKIRADDNARLRAAYRLMKPIRLKLKRAVEFKASERIRKIGASYGIKQRATDPKKWDWMKYGASLAAFIKPARVFHIIAEENEVPQNGTKFKRHWLKGYDPQNASIRGRKRSLKIFDTDYVARVAPANFTLREYRTWFRRQLFKKFERWIYAEAFGVDEFWKPKEPNLETLEPGENESDYWKNLSFYAYGKADYLPNSGPQDLPPRVRESYKERRLVPLFDEDFPCPICHCTFQSATALDNHNLIFAEEHKTAKPNPHLTLKSILEKRMELWDQVFDTDFRPSRKSTGFTIQDDEPNADDEAARIVELEGYLADFLKARTSKALDRDELVDENEDAAREMLSERETGGGDDEAHYATWESVVSEAESLAEKKGAANIDEMRHAGTAQALPKLSPALSKYFEAAKKIVEPLGDADIDISLLRAEVRKTLGYSDENEWQIFKRLKGALEKTRTPQA